MQKGNAIKQACFACTTPYQVLGAINIARHWSLQADLYIFSTFQEYNRIANNLEKEGMFNQVIAVDLRKRLPLHRKRLLKDIGAFLHMLFPEHYVDSFLPDGVLYEYFYSSSQAHGKAIFREVLQRRNPKMKTIIYDDGMGTYTKNSSVLEGSSRRRKVATSLGWLKPQTANTILMPYLPDLVNVPDHLMSCEIVQMPRLDINEKTRRLLNSVFDVADTDVISEPVIIYDTFRGSDRTNPFLFEKLDECYRDVLNVFSRSDVICKPHPRSTKLTTVDAKLYTRTSIPMEVLYTQMENIEERLLISHYSTALFTPKILFGAEPRIVSLHRIVGNVARLSDQIEYTFKQFQNVYEDKSRIFAPKTTEELRQWLESIL